MTSRTAPSTALLPSRSPVPAAGSTDTPKARFALAAGLLVLVLLVASAGGLDANETAWAVVFTAGLLGAGLALPLLLTATLGLAAWGWFTVFTETRSGDLAFAGDDVLRLAVFLMSTLAVAVFVRRIHHVIKENAHG